jgi:hypothetical protein
MGFYCLVRAGEPAGLFDLSLKRFHF